MPDSDSLSPQVLAVVARWNPQGSALLQATAPESPDRSATGATVALIGPDDATTAQLRVELSRFEPRLPLSDPIADPAAATLPPGVALMLLDAGATLGAATLELIRLLHAN
ncbi:hypothetical protein ACW9HQ_51475, partial [Nocardia gipuzkoensis]